ncbi:hypothetical protein BDQ17DRAFT_1277689 [Cyathus striatus]|nr:hypothetical protein BDQ17DRAFT_1277689 [Cyathus striatus]
MNNLPSPPSSKSPSPPHPDSSPALSRKRQRTLSMASHSSSSSIKRSASEARSPPPDNPVSHSPNHDIDAYMATQGEPLVPSPLSIPPHSDPLPPSVLHMSPPDKYAYVETEKQKQMALGDTWYLVASVWWKSWKAACTGQLNKDGPLDESDLGPVDNSPLVDQYGNLTTKSIVETEDVEYVPQSVWSAFITWYGEPRYPLPRRVINRGRFPAVEYHPPRFKVFTLTTSSFNVDTPTSNALFITLSSMETIQTLCTRLADAVSPNTVAKHPPFRVWKLVTGHESWTYAEYPVDQLKAAEAKIIDASDKTIGEEDMLSNDAFAIEFKQAEGWMVKNPEQESSLTASEPLFASGKGFFDKMNVSTVSPPSTSFTTASSMYGRSSSNKVASLALTMGSRNAARPLEPGTLGLANMGNTCFMNSALQCLAHTKELTEYFLSGVYQDELNPDNPLGMHGAIANAFGDLLQRIWTSNGTSTSYSPREFKSQLQRFAPQFTGYQQHDSQELVAFLLDGLHEDLNRVLKKPYVEKPDWEGGGDLELIDLARKSWEGYMLRNDSVIVDLFQGQYKSTLVCPECEKVSITFDPFMYLTLPLPIHKKWKHEIFYVPWDDSKPQVKVPVEINRDASFRDLRNLLGRWMGAPPENLMTLEIFQSRFYKVLDDYSICSEMSNADTIVCFELPCPSQHGRAYKRREGDPFVLPLYLADADRPRNASSRLSEFGYPTIVVVDEEQAKSFDGIYKAVVARLRRWTVHARELYSWEPGHFKQDDVDEVVHLNSFPPIKSVTTEIIPNGDVVTVQAPSPEEGDIVDEKSMIVDEMDADLPPVSAEPQMVGVKKDVLTLQLCHGGKGTGNSVNYYNVNSFAHWEDRAADAEKHPVLLREYDFLVAEFDENMKAFYFGDSPRFELALWNEWEEFQHPEYIAAKQSASETKKMGITLQDCLDEFTKEEKLGEDDLWYCPRCKKHQQATKRFDLWKVPDILVVHLKRFSNSRALRDKIEAFIDFPVEGLDISELVGERGVAKRLLEQGADIESLGLGDVQEPLVYDLFGVDEHMGGLGGGHYRAYAQNHMTGKWHHFDDSFVTQAKASDAVNANAYLLFYRRRSSAPLGGKTNEKIEEAHENPKVMASSSSTLPQHLAVSAQLPTPPNELEFDGSSTLAQLPALDAFTGVVAPTASPSLTDSPPDFEDVLSETALQDDASYVMPNPNIYDTPPSKPSPTSSLEMEADDSHFSWEHEHPYSVNVSEAPDGSPSSLSRADSPTSSSVSEVNPFADANVQKQYDD